MNWFKKLSAAYTMSVEESYAFMGLQRGNVSESEFKRRYRELARNLHPDRAKEENRINATESFKQLQAAAKIVLDDIANSSKTSPQVQNGKEWHDPSVDSGEWAEQFKNAYPNFNDFLKDVNDNPFYDNLDEADAYDQENAYVAWGMKRNNAKKKEEHNNLLIDERNKLPDPQTWGHELAVERYSTIAYGMTNVSRLKDIKELQVAYDNVTKFLSGQDCNLKIVKEWIPILFSDFGIGNLDQSGNPTITHVSASDINNFLHELKQQAGYQGMKFEIPPNYIQTVQDSGDAYLKQLLQKSFKPDANGRLDFNRIAVTSPSEKILNMKVDKFVDDNLQLYIEATGSLSNDESSLQEAREECLQYLHKSMRCDDEPDAGVFPYCIDYRYLINQGYVLDYFLNQQKYWWIESLKQSKMQPKLQSKKPAVIKIAAKQFKFHGTSGDNLQSILSEGLNFNPKRQVWSPEHTKEDQFSRESYPGVYLTSNLVTALSSGGRAKEHLKSKSKDVVIVGVEIEDRTPSIVLDEDSIFGQSYAFQDVYHVNATSGSGWWFGSWLQYSKNEADKVARTWVEFLLERFPPLENSPKDAVDRVSILAPHAIPVMIGFAEVIYASDFKRLNKWDQQKWAEDFPNAERDHAAAQSRYRQAMDIFLQKARFLVQRETRYSFNASVRVKEPISYSGVNKIVFVATISYHGLETKYYETVKIHYMSNPAILNSFISQFKERVCKNFLIDDTKGNVYYDYSEKAAQNIWTVKYAQIHSEDEGYVQDESGRKFWGSKGAGCLFIRNHPKFGPQLLTVLRSEEVEEPNTWGISGGAVIPGQDDYQTAIRESKEELGSLPRNFRRVNQYVWQNPGGSFTFTTYILEVLPPDLDWTPNSFNREVAGIKWISLSDAQTIPNLHFGLEDTLNDMGENVFQSPNNFAENMNWQMKLAIKDYVCNHIKIAQERSMGQKTLAFLLGMSPVVMAGFLTWLYQQKHMTPQQVSQMATENIPAMQQHVKEYQQQEYQQPIFEEQNQPDNFGNILNTTLKFEGGYVNHPKDPGGETNKGITRKTYTQYLTEHGLPTNNINMRQIPQEHIYDIYSQKYWEPIHGNELPPLLSQQMFDYAVNSGPQKAIKTLQIIVGVNPDGVIGPQTINAVQNYVTKYGENSLANGILNEREKFLNELSKKHPEFRKGWMNRINQLRQMIH